MCVCVCVCVCVCIYGITFLNYFYTNSFFFHQKSKLFKMLQFSNLINQQSRKA